MAIHSKRSYFLNFIDFCEHSIVNQGTLSFYWDSPDTASPRKWLTWAYDLCIDHDYACLFICERCNDGEPLVVPVFSYSDDLGYFYPISCNVVDPSHEEFDCFIDSYDAFAYACSVSTFPHPDIRFIIPELDKCYLKQEADYE